MIKVFPHPPVDQEYVSNKEEAVKDLEHMVQENQPMDVKNFVRKEALKTLLSVCDSEKDAADIVLVKEDTDQRPLTELEELDLYFDFDYDKDNKNKITIIQNKRVRKQKTSSSSLRFRRAAALPVVSSSAAATAVVVAAAASPASSSSSFKENFSITASCYSFFPLLPSGGAMSRRR